MAYVDLENLIQHWNEVAHESECADITACLEQDADDAQNVLHFLEHENMEGAMFALNRMDTAPREEVVMAIYADMGNDFIRDLGWEVA